MARLSALALLIALMVILQRTASDGVAPRTVGLALGFALVAATLLGSVAEKVRLPRLTGYLFFGLICGPYLLNLLTPTMAVQLQIVNGLAIVLIALIAGLEINLVRMKDRLGSMLTFGGVILATMFAGLFGVLALAWPWLPIAPEVGGIERIAIAGVVATLIVSFSPTVTIAVIAESRARGPLSELVLTIVILADLALILIFTLAMQFARSISGGTTEEISLLVRLLWEILGSLTYGALLGAFFALYLRFVARELSLVLVGLCVLIVGTSTLLDFESLLVALVAGMIVENIAPPRGDELRDAVERSALPILVIFFVAAGASLHLDAVAEIGLLAVGVSATRLGWIRIGSRLATRVTGLNPSLAGSVWMGMVSQAGVTLGLATIVAAEFTDWGVRVQTLIVAMIALHEIIGPMLFRAALANAGEIGRLDADGGQPDIEVTGTTTEELPWERTRAERDFPLSFGCNAVVLSESVQDFQDIVEELRYILDHSRTRGVEILFWPHEPGIQTELARLLAELRIDASMTPVFGRYGEVTAKHVVRKDCGFLVVPDERFRFLERLGIRRTALSAILQQMEAPIAVLRGSQPYRKILLPLADAAPMGAARLALDLAELHRATVTVVPVGRRFIRGGRLAKTPNAALDSLRDMAEASRVAMEQIQAPASVGEIAVMCAEYDLLVLSHRKDWKAFFFSDMSMHLLRHAPISTIVLPVDGRRRQTS